MDKIINEENVDDYRDGSLYYAIRTTMLNIIEAAHPGILENNQLTEKALDEMVSAVSDNDEVNDYIDSKIHERIDEFIEENHIEEEEEL